MNLIKQSFKQISNEQVDVNDQSPKELNEKPVAALVEVKRDENVLEKSNDVISENSCSKRKGTKFFLNFMF